jgi:hypothetical protein
MLHQALKCENPLCKCSNNFHEFSVYAYTYDECQDSVVSIVTCYGLDSSGFESKWRKEILSSPTASLNWWHTKICLEHLGFTG